MVEKFRKTSIQAAAPDHCYAGPGDVVCNICTRRKLKAVKSCLECVEGFGQRQRRCQHIIQLKEKELQELRKAVETLKSGAQTAVKESERMFTEMIRSIERRRSEVTELIRAQEKAEVSRAEGLLKRLEQEIAELKRTDAEMKQLSLTQDPIHFLKNIASITERPYSTTSTSVTFSQSFSLEPLKKSVSALKMQLEEKLQSVFKQEIVKISAAECDILT
ncbi:uncharacterized protein LOC134444074 [Engraulis encrasicolus]|uniref:uncharacterized protein LOC134444074 n=1 Tax=Engraulis encrasicolus TaxID=184585 RepID=UPI002FD4DA13